MAALTKAQRVWLNELGSMVAAPEAEVEEEGGDTPRDDADGDGRRRPKRRLRREDGGEPVPTARLDRLDDDDSESGFRDREVESDGDEEPGDSGDPHGRIPRPRRRPGQGRGDDGEGDPSPQSLVGGGSKEALFGFLPDIPVLPQVPLVNTRVTIKNSSNINLKFVSGSAKLENIQATFTKAPPVDVGPEGDFSITNESKIPLVPRAGGTGGEIQYDVVGDAKKARLFLKWERGGIAPSRQTQQTITPDDGRFRLEGLNSGGDDFQFDFSLKGGTGPVVPPPGQPPAPATDIQASCQITVINETGFELIRADADHERGDFMMPPPRKIAANGVERFISVETPGAKEEGCKGFVVWEVQAPAKVVWRVEWDNPEGARNVSAATLTPPTEGFRSQDVIGQGEENVPVSFTLSGGPAGPGPVVPPPGVLPPPPGVLPPPTEVPFTPPVEAKQPTLRKGDKSEDEWVEYAQMLLDFHTGSSLGRTGVFDAGMHSVVLKFQKQKKLLVDGVIGNQTWAALREGAPEKPSTDGRQPHTHVEHGVEARWTVESDRNARYTASSDELVLLVESVGDTKLDPSTQATVQVTPPGGAAKAVGVPLGPPVKGKSREGFLHKVTLKPFRATFPSVPPGAPASAYRIDAYLPQDLGGDRFTGGVTEV